MSITGTLLPSLRDPWVLTRRGAHFPSEALDARANEVCLAAHAPRDLVIRQAPAPEEEIDLELVSGQVFAVSERGAHARVVVSRLALRRPAGAHLFSLREGAIDRRLSRRDVLVVIPESAAGMLVGGLRAIGLRPFALGGGLRDHAAGARRERLILDAAVGPRRGVGAEAAEGIGCGVVGCRRARTRGKTLACNRRPPIPCSIASTMERMPI